MRINRQEHLIKMNAYQQHVNNIGPLPQKTQENDPVIISFEIPHPIMYLNFLLDIK